MPPAKQNLDIMKNDEKWTLFGNYRSASTLLILVLLTSSYVFAQVTQSDLSSNPAAPLTIDQIESVLKRGTDPSSLATIVRRRGVTFKFESSAEERLLAAKANAALMVAVGQSRKVVAPPDDPEVCTPGWLQYDCQQLLLCVAPDSDYGSQFSVIESNCARTSTAVHHSQIVAGGEGDYRGWFRMEWEHLYVCKDCKPTIEELPRAYGRVMNFSQRNVQAAHNDVDKALDTFRTQAIYSGAFLDWDTGRHNAGEDYARVDKYRASCSHKLADEADKASDPLPAAGPPISSMAIKPGVTQACPEGYSSHSCNDGMQILCVSRHFNPDDLSKLETSSNWKGAGCRAGDAPVPASGIRGDPYKAGYSRGFGAGPVIAVRVVSLEPTAVINSDFDARLSQLGIYAFDRIVQDPSQSPDCTWSMAWEQGYREGRKAYVEAIAKATARARQIEATQGRGKKTPQ